MLCIPLLLLWAKLTACVLDENLEAKYQTMPRAEFIKYFNKQNYSWKITNYGNDITRAFGGHIDFGISISFPEQIHDSSSFENLPENFDSREKWSQCETIKEVYDQGDCNSSWAFSAANTASDRTCIHNNEHVHLSEEDFECLTDDVCKGGKPGGAFMFWILDGLVTEKCKPYNITKLKQNNCTKQCVNKETNYTQDKHYAKTIHIMNNFTINDIKAELFNNGPAQATFKVYEDFLEYKEGVYEHKYGEFVSFHSVRVIGYGVENNKPFWLATNSWGAKWGEGGHFKVKALDKDLGFESYIAGGIPRT